MKYLILSLKAFVITVVSFYFIGCFITLDVNPIYWAMLNTEEGRFGTLCIFIASIAIPIINKYFKSE
jgi:uncharacterized paraquat-inducible protein A